MRYTHLGRTGLRVSRICLGTMNFGPETDEPTSFSIMDSALEAGINFFDSANVYGRSKGRGATEKMPMIAVRTPMAGMISGKIRPLSPKALLPRISEATSMTE